MFSLILNREYSCEDMVRQVYFGNYFHSISFTESQSVVNGFIAVENGKIIAAGSRDEYSQWKNEIKDAFDEITLSESQFLLPGFIDCHIHAPQFPNLGLGLDKPLLDWLNSYTFPMESQYKDKAFAKHVYEKVVRRTLVCGTTTACYFGTIHKDACIILADEVNKQGQRAFIGKVSMDQQCPEGVIERTEDSISDLEEVIKYIKNLDSELITPIITPRFAITCSMDMLKDLGRVAAKYSLPIQSHISENVDEVKFTLELFPGHKTYADVYDAAKLLTNRCIMAHGVHLEDEEIQLFAKRGTSVAHCPSSNTNLKSGMCDVKRLIDKGVKVGLGTDVSGGNRISIYEAVRAALDVSIHLKFAKSQNILGTGRISNSLENGAYEPLDYKQGLFLATLGGAQALGIEDKVGNFLVGKSFDAILIDAYAGNVDQIQLPNVLTEDVSDVDKFEKLIQKFVYSGDDRNIAKVYVNGNQVK